MKVRTSKRVVKKAAAIWDRSRLDKAFNVFADAKGWDADRRIQVLAELSYHDSWNEMLDALVEAGWIDGFIQQLHQYYGQEEDYFSRLLKKLLQVKPTAAVKADLVEKVIGKLTEIKAR